MNDTIKVVIADDHKLVRDGFKLLIRKHKRIKLVGEAGDGFELLEIAHKLHPDVVVLDIGMPRMDGIEATKRLKEELPDIEIIVLSMFASPARIEEIMEAGARGYLMKNADQEEMLVGIEAVNDGREFFCSESIKVLEQQEVNDKKVDFTEREIEIIKHICEQKSNKQIAAELKISPRTVESHRNTIMHKLRANNVAGIALYATRNSLI
jgi:DNA-binding NarL/FixJ family response regulator